MSGQFSCVQHSYCVNQRGTYACMCAKGYKKDGHTCVRVPDTCPLGLEVVNGTCQGKCVCGV